MANCENCYYCCVSVGEVIVCNCGIGITVTEKIKWQMPTWMEPYREHICNTGGNSIEDLMNGRADPFANGPLSVMQISVKCQVRLLERLNAEGWLREGG